MSKTLLLVLKLEQKIQIVTISKVYRFINHVYALYIV